MVFADLHTHSTASDGQYHPEEVVEKAKNAGIQIMALTDHDTVEGVAEAVKMGERIGVQVLRGIEVGAKEYPNLHILGYQYSEECPHLRALCREMLDKRNRRNDCIIDYLKEKGIELSLDEVVQAAGGKVVGRPHFAKVMVRHGYVKSNREAFDRYLDTEEYQKIDRLKPEVQICIDAIHADGGIACWAHPYQTGLDFDGTKHYAQKLKEMGIDAIECFYPRYTPEQTAFYCALAEQLGLHYTGGSDFHGEKVKPDIHLMPWAMNLQWLTEHNAK